MDRPDPNSSPEPSRDEPLRQEIERLRHEVEQLRRGQTEPAEAAPPENGAEPATVNPAWERVLLARHPQRPTFLDFVRELFADFVELHGDRRFGDDPALLGGFASFQGRQVMLIGQQRGRDVKEKIRCNFGMAKPEGYRKALRLMRLAEKFQRPILTFVDTQGAYPGVDAEERGQAEAIALNLREMARLGVPVIATVTGEGGSGGALGIAVGNRVLMLENAMYSVISPEGCASIMWRDADRKQEAAMALRLTAPELLGYELVDEIVPEPAGGAHLDAAAAARLLGEALQRNLASFESLSPGELRAQRYERFRRLGPFFTEA
ncbi:MAG TPA: acetyl-CoA carboxylase carboxyltransferase subunit alpha [Terriglobales bacterium]|nr:acetyl-CoA carboxylase carboxyltransferase subunit alpha [Terriglobales bacterium]